MQHTVWKKRTEQKGVLLTNTVLLLITQRQKVLSYITHPGSKDAFKQSLLNQTSHLCLTRIKIQTQMLWFNILSVYGLEVLRFTNHQQLAHVMLTGHLTLAPVTAHSPPEGLPLQ